MEKQQNEEVRATLLRLAGQIGVNLKDEQVPIATPEKDATVRMYDNSLEVRIASKTHARSPVIITPARSPGIYIEPVDHTKDNLAPENAFYQITVFMPGENGNPVNTLNGDIYSIYVGKKGLILSEAAKRRATDLLLNQKKSE